jgi:hypothetical protein
LGNQSLIFLRASDRGGAGGWHICPEPHDLARRVRREPSPQDPNELIGLGDGDPVEISTKGALFQQSERDHVKQLGVVLTMRNEKANVSIPFLTILEDLFDGRTSTGP